MLVYVCSLCLGVVVGVLGASDGNHASVIVGRIAAPDGAAIPGAEVRGYWGGPPATSDADGRFGMSLPVHARNSPRVLLVRAVGRACCVAAVEGAGPRFTCDAVLGLGCAVRGRVVDGAGAGVRGVMVRLRGGGWASISGAPTSLLKLFGLECAITDEAGGFVFAGLPADSYYLEVASVPDGQILATRRVGPVDPERHEEDRVELGLFADDDIVVSGSVIDASTGAAVSGASVEIVEIVERFGVSATHALNCGRAGKAGDFEVRIPASVRHEAVFRAHGYAELVVPGARLSGDTYAMFPERDLAVLVVSVDGLPVAGARVSVSLAGGNWTPIEMRLSRGEVSESVVVDGAGMGVLPGLPAATLVVKATSASGETGEVDFDLSVRHKELLVLVLGKSSK